MLSKIIEYFESSTKISGYGSISILNNNELDKIIILLGDTDHDKKGCKNIDDSIDVYCLCDKLYEILNHKINFYLEDDIEKTELPSDIQYALTNRCNKIERNIKHDIYDSLTELKIKFNSLDYNKNIIYHKSDIRNIFYDIPYIKDDQIEYYEVMFYSAIVIDKFNELDRANFIHFFTSSLKDIEILKYIWWICNFVNDFSESENLEQLKLIIIREIENIDSRIKIIINKYINIIIEIINFIVDKIKKTNFYNDFNKLIYANPKILITKHKINIDFEIEDILEFFKYIKYLQILTYYNDLYLLAKIHQKTSDNKQEIIVIYYGYDHIFNLKNILINNCGYESHYSKYYSDLKSRKCYKKIDENSEKISQTIETIYLSIK